ncbi:protein-tyrosine-phosphatase [Photorhabdus heterorhabditis]|uniref:protein-tyrosine-phosphatase n=1 Tax=Photorhabdus heterorhabditis TaxID=880156 RepID=A0A5B0X972_9GAMM|nr:protein-tyrosine-phosphatase [Photorhabdus heterorhabditis]KAA1194921.1 protein tyrosine phosphatase [Photorhabdus heterorhabditis]KOY60740.1 protein tyrosine phosphatase [Photorhabdus heterorhabditis]MBS9442321.1 protein tyrosine phosphatase [Photorhabdus heterorhabditis]
MFNSILIVCVGNICRSPTGERLLRRLFPQKEIYSAGISALIGKPAHELSSKVAARHGLSLGGHTARQLTSELCQQSNLILVMEKKHIEAVNRVNLGARGKTMLLGHWLSEMEIPDPYKSDTEVYEYVYQLLFKSANSWLGKL